MSQDVRGPDDPMRPASAQGGAGFSAAPEPPASSEEITLHDITADLPARLRPRPPRTSRVPPWVGVALVLLVVAIVIPAALLTRGGTTGPRVPAGCDVQDSPCSIALAYLTYYTSGKYDAMYQLVSTASKTRFSDKAILAGNYTDAHDYIVNRTKALLQEAEVYDVQATPGDQRITGATTATVPASVVMQTIRTGTITQSITIPLVLENGRWHVNWSPGLVFAHLDDPADPQYQRHLHLFLFDGHRGRILDRNGKVLAQDDTVYDVGIVPSRIKNETVLLQTLGKDLDFTPTQIKQKYQGVDPSQFVLIRTIAAPLYAQAQADLAALQANGVDVRTRIGRVYPYGADAAAVTGFVAPVSDQDLINDTAHYYEPNDVVGRAGIEGWADTQIRPVKGGELDIVPLNSDGSFGPAAYTLGRRVPADGPDVHTTLDIALQQKAMAAMRQQAHPSSSVVLDPASGDVLVLASNPIYDPTDLSLGFTPNAAARFSALDHPYLNRAIGSALPIGSVLKVSTLAAALENGIPPDQAFNCTGTYTVPGQSQPLHDWEAHGATNPIKGLAQSCDVTYWQIGVTLNSKDPNILPTMAKGFGYGAKTGIIGLPSADENPGIVPDPAWMQATKNSGWAPIDAANLAVGQGFFEATSLQVAEAAAAIADNGQRMQPRLVTALVGSAGETVTSYAPKSLGTLPLSPDHLAILQAAMLGPTTTPDGTSCFLFCNFPIRVAGKTGSAESGEPVPHAVFMAYAPAPPVSGPWVTPKTAVSALVENAGHGADFAAPIVQAVLRAYFNV